MKKQSSYRVSLENAISHPKDSSKTKDIPVVTNYDINGNKIEGMPDEKVTASSIEHLGSKIFRIKAERNGKLFNPLKIDIFYGLEKRDRTTNEALFKYKNVNQKAFTNYIKFLKEKHDSLLLIAEREKA